MHHRLQSPTERLVLQVQVGAALCALVILVVVATSILAGRGREVNSWKQYAASSALMLTEYTGQVLYSASVVLDDVARDVEAAARERSQAFRTEMKSREMHDRLRDAVRGHPELDTVSVVAADGEVLNFTRSFPPPTINLSDRDYFAARKDGWAEPNYVGLSARNRGNGKWTFFLSRAVKDSKGQFAGLVVIPVSIDTLSGAYAKVIKSVGEGVVVALHRADMRLLMRTPWQDELIGQTNRSGATVRGVEELRDSGLDNAVLVTASPRFSDGDTLTRMVAVQRVKDYPIYLSLIIPQPVYLATWWRSTQVVLWIALPCLLLLGAGAVALTRSARERERVAADLAAARDAALAADRAKSRFLSSMSHELRTPLNGVLGHTQLLLLDASDERQREQLDAIQRAGWQLSGMVDQVLELSRLDQGRVSLQLQSLSVAELAQLCMTEVAPVANRRRMQLRNQVEETLQVWADRAGLHRVLGALLLNAVQYPPAVGTASLQAERTGDLVRIEVVDSGREIPAAQRAELFTAFNRLGRETSTIEGAGLGLVLAQRWVELMGGRIGYEYRVGAGNVFWVELPAPGAGPR